MARVNAQQWLAKWGTGLQGSTEAIKAGIANVKQAPGIAAAAAKDRYIANVNASVDTWAKNVSAVTTQQWQSAMTTKTLPRLASGITSAQANKQQNITAMLTAVDAAVADANAVPRGNIEQNIQRAAIFARSMAARAPKRNK